MRVVGECFFWYRLTRVFPDKFHRAVKRLCVCVCVLWGDCKIWWVIASLENFLRSALPQSPSRVLLCIEIAVQKDSAPQNMTSGLQKSYFGEQNLFALQFQYIVTLANWHKAPIKKSSAHHNFGGGEVFTSSLYTLKTDVSLDHEVFQVGQAPSGLPLIRPLVWGTLWAPPAGAGGTF